MIKNTNRAEINWRESRIPRKGKVGANFRKAPEGDPDAQPQEGPVRRREGPRQTQEGGAVAARRKARGRQPEASGEPLKGFEQGSSTT